MEKDIEVRLTILERELNNFKADNNYKYKEINDNIEKLKIENNSKLREVITKIDKMEVDNESNIKELKNEIKDDIKDGYNNITNNYKTINDQLKEMSKLNAEAQNKWKYTEGFLRAVIAAGVILTVTTPIILKLLGFFK